MSYNFVNEADSITSSNLCFHDTNVGYETDFSVNGEVDNWDTYNGVHTIGVWGGYLFATLYGDFARIERGAVFYAVPAETHYTLKITMKINPTTREAEHALPTTGRVQWATLANPTWGSDKQMDFTIYPDNYWHTYILNMGEEQYWQGDVNNLRIYPILTDGQDADEFFVKSIKIVSVDTFRCVKLACSYYSNYSHPCGGVGERGYCRSSAINTSGYTIEEGVNDELVVDINDYGNEIVRIPTVSGATGNELSKSLAGEISKTAIGGYAEVEVEYTEDGEFKIHSGTYATDSSVIVSNSSAASTLGFFSVAGANLSSTGTGTYPATLFSPMSSFKIKSFQLLSLFDNSTDSSFVFDPSIYSIEGGRRDWADSGLGLGSVSTGDDRSDTTGQRTREYNVIDNAGKTIIDFNHPFNASGKVKKISLACTLDQDWTGSEPLEQYQGRVEATGCKVLVLRPKRNGNLEVVESVSIPNRDYSGSRLYSPIQEATELDCDIWVNKGDFLGIYNANIYAGKSDTGDDVDALYYQVNGLVSGEFTPGRLQGDGIAGMLIYARSEIVQNKLVIDVDLGNRANIEDIDIIGSTKSRILEFNVARCLDINWSVNLFNATHYTGFRYWPGGGPDEGRTFKFWHDNVYYGLSKLTDGILTVPEGYAASSYSVGTQSVSQSTEYNPGVKASTFVPTGVEYFFVNGDQEWVGIYQHIGANYSNAFVDNFEDDPIAFTLLFPHGTSKSVYKSKIHFKEKGNFRNFALSTSTDLSDVYGDADIPGFTLIPEYTAVTIDNNRFTTDSSDYGLVDLYLFANPCNAKPIIETSGALSSSGNYLGVVVNNEENLQANNIDWTILEHEFDPVECRGFRFYCDHHQSTKITEMELYCQTEDQGSSMIGSLSVSHSQYGDYWWASSLIENDDGSATAFIGDTPRYFTIEIEPITKIELNEIMFNIKSEDVYVGDKGCEYEVLPVHGKMGTTNESTRLDIKNVYDGAYDLYVDVVKDTLYEEGLIFHSTLSNADSITNPEEGPDARYKKEEDYPLTNTLHNCAINSYCYGLRNLIDEKMSYYSYNSGYTWHDFGTLASGVSVDFSNITSGNMTVIVFPEPALTYRYWKIGWKALDHAAMNVREMTPFFYTDTSIVADDDFTGYDSQEPDSTKWDVEGSPYILDNKLYMLAAAGSRQDIQSKFVLVGDFDVECGFGVISYENINTWKIVLKVIDEEGDIIQVQREYSGGVDLFKAYKYIDGVGTTWAERYEGYIDGRLRLVRTGDTFDIWVWYDVKWHHIGSTTEILEQAVYVWVFVRSQDSNPTLETYIDNFVVNYGTAEIRQDQEMPCIFYHDKELDFEDGPITDTAPHLQNDSVIGSYYQLLGGTNIGMDFGSSEKINKIIWFHDAITDYDDTYCGIDKYTELNIVGKDGNIVDYSYDERTVTTVGSGIYVDTNGRFDITVTEVTATDGLYGADASPTNTTIPSKATLVDGILYPTVADNTCKCSPGYSVGIDLGSSKTVNKLAFYASSDNIGSPYFMQSKSGYDDKPYYIYKSNDNITWTLAETYNAYELGGGFPALVDMGGASGYRYAYFEFEFPGSHSARYFKLWCDDVIYWSHGGYTEKTCWINEIKAYVYTPDATSETGIRFSGHSDSYLSVPASTAFYFPGNRYMPSEGDCYPFTVDFHVKFNSLPANNGDYCTLIRSWSDVVTTVKEGDIPYPPDRAYHNTTIENTGEAQTAACWAIFVRNVSGVCYLECWHQHYWWWTGQHWARGGTTVYDPIVTAGETYHVSYESTDIYDVGNATGTYVLFYVNGLNYAKYGYLMDRDGLSRYWQNNIKVGDGLDGWMSDVRITNKLRREPPRGLYGGVPYKYGKRTDIAIANERYYTMSLYTSSDNATYNKYYDIDLYYDNSYSAHSANSIFSSNYYSYLAIDLENRYDLDWIRSYGSATNKYKLSFFGENSENIYYSNDDTDNVDLVTWTGRDDYENDQTLYSAEVQDWGAAGSYADPKATFTPIDCSGLTKVNGLFSIQIKVSQADYENYIDFDKSAQIELSSSTTNNVNEWYYNLQTGIFGSLEDITDEYYTFYIPMDGWTTTGGEMDVSQIQRIRVYMYNKHSTLQMQVLWQNASVVWPYQDALTVIDDVRWLRIGMLSGDGTTRTLKKIGLYPDINTQLSPAGGSYNHLWDSLGASITSYQSSTNLALGATVSGSSYFGMQYLAKVTDGVINATTSDETTVSLYDVWGSTSSSPQWVCIDLGATYSIYRVKVYHGYDGADTTYIITDYKVQTSLDGQTYTDRFTISDNSSFERTHDLAVPVDAQHVRIYITGWDYSTIYLRTNVDGDMEPFKGAVLREVQVYEYYGYPSISSEVYPVICLNMRDQFFIDSHSIVGFDAEDSSDDWNNSDENFTYSDSVLTEPQKVDFRAWGDDPYYDQWMVVKMDTATNYKSGPHYLKHVRAEGTYAQNPCDYPWWWQSSVSTISRNYDYDVNNCISAMKIEYPASTTVETISFIEGDDFGTDEYASWRDGFNFRFRADNMNNLDLSYGYFYFGGYDSSTGENPITYKWNMSTLSGALTASGVDDSWINLYLRFKSADDVSYIEPPAGESDPRIVSDLTLGSMGMVFRGIGNPITMHLDGFKIMRNHFQDYSSWGSGLYLHKDDYLTIPLGEYDLSKGTVEFWMRPDFNQKGYDYYDTLQNRAIFYCNNNANDIFGLMFSYNGMEVYFGNIADGVISFTLTDLGVSLIDYLFHLGFVFSNDGTQIDSDGSTIRVYFDNVLIAKSTVTWSINDNKHFNFVLGGKGPVSIKQTQWSDTSSVDSVISQLKIYNYCKLDFADSIKNVEDGHDNLVKPSSLIEISRDNLTYYKARDPNLPFKFSQVPANNIVPIYTRLTLPDNLTGKEIRTAGLLVYWDVNG